MTNNNTRIISLLEEELIKCHAPVTGYCVTTAIVTEKDTYIEHNHEDQDSVVFEHAEIRVLEKILKKEQSPIIKRVYMLGGGAIKKIKHYTPCYACTHKMAPYITSNTTVTLLPLLATTALVTFNYNELLSSYSDVPYSKFSNTSKQGIQKELRDKTILKGKDIDFIADLILLGLREKFEFYLTGSSTGRGGVSRLLMEKTKTSYGDIDIIVVVAADYYKMAIENIEKVITLHYGAHLKEERLVPLRHNKLGVVLGKAYYRCSNSNEKMLDFTFSTDFKGSLSYHAYELKNWFHQLS